MGIGRVRMETSLVGEGFPREKGEKMGGSYNLQM
jgi:hypothetical protein